MKLEEKLELEKNWKETAKKIVDKSNNYNDYQKEVFKFILEMFYYDRKKSIIKSEEQAKIIEEMVKQKVD